MISERAQRDGFGTQQDVIASLGTDIGPTTGMCLAVWSRSDYELLGVLALECTAAMSYYWLRIMSELPGWPRFRAMAMEEFREGPRSKHLKGVSPVTMREQSGRLLSYCQDHELAVRVRPAAAVKPWATDKRLEAAGLMAPTEKFTDARDAARHALYCAVADLGLPDPLSRTAFAKIQDGGVMMVPHPAASSRGVMHDHLTRDIKPEGKCAGCDAYHAWRRAQGAG